METPSNSSSGVRNFLATQSSPLGEVVDGTPRRGELLEKLIDMIPVMIVIWEPDVSVLRFNREFERVLGWTHDDAQREDFIELLYPDPQYRQMVLSFMASLEPGWRDFDITTKSGEKVTTTWANVHLSGNRHVGIGLDVRHRRRIEQQLRERQEEIELVTDSIPVLISRVDADQRYRFANAAYEHWFGLSQDDVLGRQIKDVVGEASYRAIKPHAEAALSGRTVRFETELDLGQAGMRYVQAQYEPHRDDKTGEVVGFYAVVTDISERKRAQEEKVAAYQAMERQHELLKTVLEIMPAGVFIADSDGNLVETNAAARRIWGGDAPHLNRSSFDAYKGWFVDTGERLSADDWGMAKALRGEEVIDGQEVEIETFDGRRKTILNYALPIRLGKQFEGAVAVSVDVTKLRAAEDALRELNATLERRVAERTADLEARNKELQQFAFIASHDLREPLRKIQAFGDLLKEDDELSEEKSNFFIERIQSSAKRMDDLLDDLLTFSRVAMRTRPFQPIRVRDIVEEACSDLMLPIGETDAEIDVSADAYVEADPGQLRQLIHHLIGNAVKFRRDGERPHVRLHAAVVEGGEICRIVVEDNGIGFDPKYADKIFEPFERLHERGTYEGTGMGLAICHRIVQLHRGSIAAESTPGEGSRFVVELPARAEADVPEISES